MKALGMYIFGGSQTIGHLLEGWKIDTILEMTENMKEANSYHFVKNYPEIDVKLPSEYSEDKAYIKSLKDQKYDLLFANPPCSGLSQINKHASADNKTNRHLYNVFTMIKNVEPKTFLIENAPTLTTTGFPILKVMSRELGNKYFILILNDLAGNHGVAMHRRRTLVVGFNKEYFKGIPKINSNKRDSVNVKDILAKIDYKFNKEYAEGVDENLFKYYNQIPANKSLYGSLADTVEDTSTLDDTIQKPVQKLKDKISRNEGIWDKSPWRSGEDSKFPSMTSLTRIVHPTEDRELYIREYAAIMGYPNDFVFYPEECSTPTVQCIAQGVPVNFIRYISREIMDSFKAKDFYDGEIIYINQTNVDNLKIAVYESIEQFCKADNIHSTEITLKNN